MIFAIQSLTFIEMLGIVVLSIFTVFIAIRLWSYAYFKSKWEQYTDKVRRLNKML